MTTIHIQKQKVQRATIIGLLLMAIVLGVTAIWLSWSTTGNPTKTQQVVTAEVDTPANKPLSASMALANDKATLLVFRPVEKCSIQYCLNADAVSAQLAADLREQIDVIDVPVYAITSNTADTPPSFLRADWDLYPVIPYTDMMPLPELTEFGWSIHDTKMILVSSDGQRSATLYSILEIDEFDSFLLN
jgi:hypothetical protein